LESAEAGRIEAPSDSAVEASSTLNGIMIASFWFAATQHPT
jgi:hypothetical protein